MFIEQNIQTKHLGTLRQIFEDRFVFEEGAYRAYVTDEKRNITRKDK